jgi:hypothetical protein
VIERPGAAPLRFTARNTRQRPNYRIQRSHWNCPDLTHTKFSWQACRQGVCGGKEATTLRSGVQG